MIAKVETLFTPFASFGGGLLIGLGAVLLMLGLGRILGATGILSGLVFAENGGEFAWRAAMIVGMILAPGIIFLVTGTMPELSVPVSPRMIIVGGVIVGFGCESWVRLHIWTRRLRPLTVVGSVYCGRSHIYADCFRYRLSHPSRVWNIAR